MKQITERRSLELAAAAWMPGTKMQTIIVDGWSRGFRKSQTLHECIQAGYSACIAGPAIDTRWAVMDAEIEALMEREKSERTAHRESIERYEAYWAKRPDRSHHEIDCPAPFCDHRLKINRPERGSGEMWDSLATCPYCTGTFFYESRPLRIDVSFKGFL